MTANEVAHAYVTLVHTWTASVSPVTSWTWPTLATTWTASTDFGSNRRISLQNIAGPFLIPGTFTFNPIDRVITYRLATGESPIVLTTLLAPALGEIVVAAGSPDAKVESVRMVNLTLAHTAARLEEDCMVDGCSYQSCADSSGAAMHLHGAHGWTLEGLEITSTGQTALWIEDACTDINVSGAWLHDMGAGGVRVGVTAQGIVPNASFALTRGVRLTDSIVEDGGLLCAAGTGILWHNAADGVIEHNEVTQLRYTGISVGWTWSYEATSTANVTVRKNYVHDVGLNTLSDLAGIYLVGPQPGSLVEGNLVTDVSRGGNGAHCFYIDQACSGTIWRGNVGVGAADSIFQVHYGMDNRIENNIFAAPGPSSVDTTSAPPWPCAYPLDCGAAGLRSGKHAAGDGEGAFSAFSFTRNIVALGADASAVLFITAVTDGLANMSFANNTYWRDETASTLQFPSTQDPTTFEQWQLQDKDTGSGVDDPMFVNAKARNFTVRAGSPALARGFEQVDTRDVGPRRSVRPNVWRAADMV